MIAIYKKVLYKASTDSILLLAMTVWSHDSASVMVQEQGCTEGPGSVLCVFLVPENPGPPPDCIKMFCVHSHHESEALRALPGKCPSTKRPTIFLVCLWNICMVAAFLSGHDWKLKVSSQQRWAFSCFVSLAVLRHNWHVSLCRLRVYNVTVWCTLCNDYHDYVVSNPVTSYNYYCLCWEHFKIYSLSNIQV